MFRQRRKEKGNTYRYYPLLIKSGSRSKYAFLINNIFGYIRFQEGILIDRLIRCVWWRQGLVLCFGGQIIFDASLL